MIILKKSTKEKFMGNLNKYEAKIEKLVDKITAGDYSFSNPAERFQMLTISVIGVYNETRDWIVKALENPDADLKDLKDYQQIDFSAIKALLYSLLSSIPIQVSRKLVGLKNGIDFVCSVIDIFNKYDNNEDRRIKFTTLLRKYENLNDELIKSFVVLEEIGEMLNKATKINKKGV